MQKVMGKDGMEYIELNGTWYVVDSSTGRINVASRPREYESCEVFNKNEEQNFFTKHLLKKKGEA